MFETAVKAAENSYSPYSEFRVGAALLTESGEILTMAVILKILLILSQTAPRERQFSKLFRRERENLKPLPLQAEKVKIFPGHAIPAELVFRSWRNFAAVMILR